jgi:hypothetical protein
MPRCVRTTVLAASLTVIAPAAYADLGGVPFWLSGQFPSLSASPVTPGFSLGVNPYFYSGSSSASRKLQIGTQLVTGLDASIDLLVFQPSYTFSDTILGGQPRVSLAGGPGYSQSSFAARLSNPSAALSLSESLTGFTDLYPMVNLAWNEGASNWMIYGTGDIPVGSYDIKNIANLGIGHGAADFGGGYTYWDHAAGLEFTAVGGVTINAENNAIHYTNGVDAHLDWAASAFLSKNWQLGVVGYVYDQISADSGPGNLIGPIKSKIASVGAEVGYLFAVANRPAYFNLRGYYEFWAENRVKGGALFATLVIPIGESPGRMPPPAPH